MKLNLKITSQYKLLRNCFAITLIQLRGDVLHCSLNSKFKIVSDKDSIYIIQVK